MLIKEYRIPLPLSVEEYRIAQLYMIAKKSREESQGAGSGIEIIINEPYEEGPGGSGQYTHKVYHVGRHLPGWLKALLPKSALSVNEEAWNAYPYTKTRYTCPFVEKFFIEIETLYTSDAGSQENVFNQTNQELRQKTTDLIDIVKDQLFGSDYAKNEDPTFFQSEKTNRGPLNENWINECIEKKEQIMCAYKLCKVEFKYWGMQSKIEKFIHDTALRRVMLRAHRQAWAWQDEWFGLTMTEIRLIEKETQELLAKKMAESQELVSSPEDSEGSDSHLTLQSSSSFYSTNQEEPSDIYKSVQDKSQQVFKDSRSKSLSSSLLDASAQKTDSFERLDGENSSDEEFFDAEDTLEHPLAKWSSLEFVSNSAMITQEGIFSSAFTQSTKSNNSAKLYSNTSARRNSMDGTADSNESQESSSHQREDMSSSPRPKEKWLRKRTSIKLKNVAANHRANDVIVKEGVSQTISGRFMYGPLDVVALTGERVDIYTKRNGVTGEWTYLGTEVTDKTGRITYTLEKESSLAVGIYPIRMIVRGDQTSIEFFLTVVPPNMECVVFSIDGSFTANISVTGRDPKIRAGAVDVVRYWQELGYIIIYITGRPDMQQHRVVSWLAQHNFPHGLISFADRLSTDPLKHKADCLKAMQRDAEVIFHAAYGSSKDIWVYQSLGLKMDQTFIVGKVSKKHQLEILSDGYAAHLVELISYHGSRPAKSKASLICPSFRLPGLGPFGGMLERRPTKAKRTTSNPAEDNSENSPISTTPTSLECNTPPNMFVNRPGSSKSNK